MTTTLEDRLESAAQDVRRGVGGMQGRRPESISIRRRRQKVLVTSTAAVAVVASLLGAGMLAGNAPTAAPEVTPSAATSLPEPLQTPTEGVAETPRASFWAATLANWAGILEAGVLKDGLDAHVIEYWETATPMPDGGSLGASVEATEAQLTLVAEFHAFAEGEYRDDPDWQMGVASAQAEGVTTEVGTSFFSDSSVDEQGVPATFFYTEATDGSRLMTVVSPFGQVVVRADAVDPVRLPEQDRLNAIATGMTSTAYDLVFALDPDDPLPSTEVQSPPSPTDEQWIQLADDVWIATVAEGDDTRVWVKTDTQAPMAAPSTDTRSLLAKAGDSDLIVVVFDESGQDIPRIVTARWSDGGSESGDLAWDEERGLGLARLEWRDDVELSSIDGP